MRQTETVVNASTGAIAKRFAEPGGTRERVTEDAVKDPRTLAELLTRLVKDVQGALQILLSSRSATPLRWVDQACGAAGAQFTVTHKLGRSPQWRVCGWRGAAAGPSLVEVSRDANTLVLASYVAGTVDLEVY